MQTRMKVVARNGSREHASPKFRRQQKKVTVVTEKKVKELISSVKKQKSARICSTKIKDVEETKVLTSAFALVQDEVANDTSLEDERSNDQPMECVLETIFSPTYHPPKERCGAVTDKVDFMKFFKNNNGSAQSLHWPEESKGDASNCQITSENQLEYADMEMEVTLTHKCDGNGDTANTQSEAFDMQKNDAKATSESIQANKLSDDKYRVMGNLSCEVSAIYLAMQNSKLECVDEHTHDSITEDCEEPDDSDMFDDFDPYTFIKDLPDLSAVVPKFRSVLLPKQTRSCPSTTLVLDLDGTVH